MKPSRRDKANAIRALSMDAVQRANSGHPGAPMGMADIMEVLWCDFLRHHPGNPQWADRDRFVLSNGHGSMLLYALLHLTGYPVSMDDLREFRQLHSRTPGHPEFGDTPGVETTTGPLGQGLANAVGMALAEALLAAEFNREDHAVVDHHTYVALGDGCLMEGISHEVCSLAGTLGLGKLIGLYDDNRISIDGPVDGWFTDDTPARFAAYGWHVVPDVDGHDPEAVRNALEAARAETRRPSLLCCRTTIGYGAPNKAGSADTHGAPLGEGEVAATRTALRWPHAPFTIPTDIAAAWDCRARGAALEARWRERLAAYRGAYPRLAAEFERRVMQRALPVDWEASVSTLIDACRGKGGKLATRKASQQTLEVLGPVLPELIGGSADLTGSVGTLWAGAQVIKPGILRGNYLHYGVREFGMSAIMNGLALHGGFIPYGGTFLVFSDYARNAVRMAALMGTQSIFVFTHDSIGLGEDGPTHQAIEHTASLRLVPGLSLWRPCDQVETAVAWQAALRRRDGPTALLLTRQGVAYQERTDQQVADIQRGGYILVDAGEVPEAIILATGSEVDLAVQSARQLNAGGRRIRVVSMPSTDVFDAQDEKYRERVLPRFVTARLAVEAGATHGWWKYVGSDGRVIGIDRFGASAPGATLFEHFGFTVDRVTAAVTELVAGQSTLN